uniref:Uncharacterized protein n=1 Tax=Anser brachyrhynchus TaxID=132585 RepID=A0A8B9ICL7_9AVES
MEYPFGQFGSVVLAVSLPASCHAGVSASMMKKRTSHKKHRNNVGPSKPISQPRRNIVGCRIQHGWKEGSGPVTQWKGTVLDQFQHLKSFQTE